MDLYRIHPLLAGNQSTKKSLVLCMFRLDRQLGIWLIFQRQKPPPVQGGFLKMSYFEVKNGRLRAFLGQKTKYLDVFWSKHVNSGQFECENATLDLLQLFFKLFSALFRDIFAKPPCMGETVR